MAMSRAQRFAAALAVLGPFAIGFLPLFDGPGYEAALAAGLLLPTTASVATALDTVTASLDGRRAFARGITTGALLGVLGWLVTLVHGVRVGFCDAVEGSEMFLLGPGIGAIMGGVWGAVSGLVAVRHGRSPGRIAVLLSALGPLGGIVVSLWRFYTSPMVFAFDPFFGFFAGTLYDSVITGLGRLATYRVGTSFTIVFAGAALSLVRRSESGEVAFEYRREPLLIATIALVGSAAHVLSGPALGHYQTTRSIREALGHSTKYGRCELVYPSGTPEIEARALARDCDGHLQQLERFFGVSGTPRVVAFLFAGTDQKGYLMGAATTYIAKPWRHEIYLQRSGFPHPVMRHELAHVVAGGFGRGPFHVSGPLAGIIPDPGRIEGVAVAGAPRDEDLSLDEWARAMRDLRLLPPLRKVFKLSFLGEPSSRAYVVAGAFVDWLRRDRGMDAVRRWYGGESLESAAGAPLSALEAAWNASLDRTAVGPDVLAVARARFDQPAIFGRRCPHVVDRLAGEAGAALGASDTVRAELLYHALLALDPHDLGARFGLATCAEHEGRADVARAAYDRITRDQSVARTARTRATELLGDRALASGNLAEADRFYAEVATLVVDADRLRALDVKRFAAKSDEATRRALIAQLFGDPQYGRDPNVAAAELGAWSSRDPSTGIPDYLLARIHFGSGRFDLASDSLERALARTLPIPSVLREALRLRMVLACALGDPARVQGSYARWSELPGPRESERRDLAEFVERCTGAPAHSATAASAAPALSPPTAVTASLVVAPTAGSAQGALPNPTSVSCPDGMVQIPGADVWIGSPRGQGVDDEWPRYRTHLSTFCMDRTEVTVGAYRRCVERGACTPADHERVTCTASGRDDDFPINCIDWTQATAFCKSRDARLPTEAEWEYAASGGDDRLYSWGNDTPDDRACWKSNSACKVGTFPAGAFGLLDMTGNVWEWTGDAYGDYPWPPIESPSKVYRGGSWSRRFEKWMRVRLRNRSAPDLRGSHLGFRCALTPRATECAFGRGPDGSCVHGVLDVECRPGRRWNGVRCLPAEEDAKGCGEGHTFVGGHGCVRDVAVEEPPRPGEDLSSVHRTRSPEFDSDCEYFQASRPHAYRLDGGTHDARNKVARSAGCKNRDVGVGWNSACCP